MAVVVPCNSDGSDEKHFMFQSPSEFASVGQLIWAGPHTLVGVAHLDISPRLGLVYCRIREAVLFSLNVQTREFGEILFNTN